ncbi:hypothetical protein AB4865_02745 [Capnocytophaga sp. ARDL2]|uniref:hypothetical protein n=1 Tax=Capnocytophaga sp. ARDL2 TaxID=3238809 RepID=UPI003557E226
MNYKWMALFFSLLLFSCFEKKQLPDAKELLRKELHAIDWKTLDQYPFLDICDSLTSEEEKRNCFFYHIQSELKDCLTKDPLIKALVKLDTVKVRVSIDTNAVCTFTAIDFNRQQISQQMLDSIMKNCTQHLPTVHTGTKRDLPVHVVFDMDISLRQ